MHADDRLLETCADFRDGKRGRIRRIDAVRISDNFILHMLEELLLQLHVLDDCFHNEIRIHCDFICTSLDLGKNVSCLFLGHLPLGDSLRKSTDNPIQSGLCIFHFQITEIYFVYFRALCKCLSNTPAHRAGSDYCYLHIISSSFQLFVNVFSLRFSRNAFMPSF